MACNTASAEALRKLQQEILPSRYPEKRVLGVLIPAAEEAVTQTKNSKIGVLATNATVGSGAFMREIKKLDSEIEVYQQAAPLLVPLIENDGLRWVDPILREYLEPLLKHSIDTLILGCTHYPLLKLQVRGMVGVSINVISQDEVVPVKLASYLHRHPEIATKLSKSGNRDFWVTDITPSAERLAEQFLGESINLKRVDITK